MMDMTDNLMDLVQTGSGVKEWPKDWPDKKHFVSQHEVTKEQYDEFEQLLNQRATEREIERFFKRHPEVLSFAAFLFGTGHHASFIFPKKQIRPSSDYPRGLIPDYVIAGASSSGMDWFILELKGANHNAFAKTGNHVHLSNQANHGICQLLRYIDVASRDQSYLRDPMGLTGFREPRGLLLIGTEKESETDEICEFKWAWNNYNPRLEIRSYHALLRTVARKLGASLTNS